MSVNDRRTNAAQSSTVWAKSVLNRRHDLVGGNSNSDSTDGDSPAPLLSETYACPSTRLKHCHCCSYSKLQNTKEKNHPKIFSVYEREKHQSGKKGHTDSNYKIQLESKVYNNELEEASFAEKLTSLNHRLQRMLSLMETQVRLAQCLDLKERTSLQFYHLASCFSLKDLKGSDSLIHTANKSVKDPGEMLKKLETIKKTAAPLFDIPEQLYQLMEEYRDKHKEYQMASNSFVEYLRSSQQCSNTQLHKLDNKYETIRSNCEYSRRILNNEIPLLINERMETLAITFGDLVSVQEDMLERDKQLLALNKEIHKQLCELKRTQSRHCNCNSTDCNKCLPQPPSHTCKKSSSRQNQS